MQLGDPAASPVARRSGEGARGSSRLAWLGGGTDGNEQLTAMTGVLLVVLLAVIGITILRIRQLIFVHLFVGLLLMGPVALKMSSTGYRFARYYSRNLAYHDKGPPELYLRVIAPAVVLSTLTVFVSGLLLLFGGVSSRDQYLELHKVSFIVWAVFAGLHVLAHLPGIPASLRAGGRGRRSAEDLSPGSRGRWLALTGALIGGLVLALALLPDFVSWTARGAMAHHGLH